MGSGDCTPSLEHFNGFICKRVIEYQIFNDSSYNNRRKALERHTPSRPLWQANVWRPRDKSEYCQLHKRRQWSVVCSLSFSEGSSGSTIYRVSNFFFFWH